MTEAIATRAEAEVVEEEEESEEEGAEEEVKEEEDGDEEEEEGKPSNGALDTMKANSSERNAPSKEMRTKNKQSSPATGVSPKKRRKVNHGEKIISFPGRRPLAGRKTTRLIILCCAFPGLPFCKKILIANNSSCNVSSVCLLSAFGEPQILLSFVPSWFPPRRLYEGRQSFLFFFLAGEDCA